MNKRYYEHTLPIIRGSLSNTYDLYMQRVAYIDAARWNYRSNKQSI